MVDEALTRHRLCRGPRLAGGLGDEPGRGDGGVAAAGRAASG